MPDAPSPIPGDAPLPLRAALPFLMIFVGLFFVNFTTRAALAPFLPHMEAEFGLGHAQAGGMYLCVSSGMSLSMLFSGLFARALGHRRTILLSTTAIGACMLAVAAADSPATLRVTFFLMGLGSGLYFPSAVSAITAILEPRHWGRGLSIHELAPNASFIALPALAAALEGTVSWRGVFAGLGTAALCMALLFAVRGRVGDFRGRPLRLRTVLGEVLRRPAFWALVLLFTMAVAASFGPYSMLALYLTDSGMSVETANTVLTASRLAGPFLVLGAGQVVDAMGARATVALTLGAAGVLTVLLGLLQGWGMTAAAVCQPALAACFFPAGLTAASQAFPKEIRNIAVSLIVPAAIFLGSGLTPPLLGRFGDAGNFPAGFMCLGAAVLCSLPVLRALPRAGRAG